MLAVGAMVLALGFTAYCLRDAGVIGSQTLLIVLILLITIPACTFMVLDGVWQAPPRARESEVPPPFDIYLVWPPADGLPHHDDRPPTAANDRDPPVRKRP